MAHCCIYHSQKIGKEKISVPQKCFIDGREVTFKNETEARVFMKKYSEKSNISVRVV